MDPDKKEKEMSLLAEEPSDHKMTKEIRFKTLEAEKEELLAKQQKYIALKARG